ncbi:MAG: hypothetical protein U0359_11565 [Byssovorax sp.]
MESALAARVQEILEAGGGETRDGVLFLPIVTLDSGAQQGIDAKLRWVLAPSGGPAVTIGAENVHLLHEALEWKRDRFDDAIEARARELSLPADDLLFSYPVTALVDAILAKRSSYLTRLALSFLRTTELRPLRAPILAVTRDDSMPGPIKDLAARLVVPV